MEGRKEEKEGEREGWERMKFKKKTLTTVKKFYTFVF